MVAVGLEAISHDYLYLVGCVHIVLMSNHIVIDLMFSLLLIRQYIAVGHPQ